MDSELRNMVMSFRVTELTCLLGFAGKNKQGRKNELQARALELVKTKHGHIVTKIRELYRSIQGRSCDFRASIPHQSLPVSSGVTNHASSMYLAGQHLTSTISAHFAGAQEKVLQGRNPYTSFNNNVVQNKSNIALISMPICPDVKFKRLPFFEVVSELIKPTSLISTGPVRMQEGNFPFCLTPQQAADVAASKELLGGSLYSSEQKIGYQMQVQLRFVLLDTSCEQEDNFPPSICVRVNGKIVPLPHPIPSNRPAIEPKRPSRPLNITNYVKLSPTCTNTVGITWVSDGLGRGWVMSLFLVKKLSASDLLQRLKNKGPRPSEFTKGMIKEIVAKDDGECQIAMTSLTVSVGCPLGKCRMTLPCRASTCKHLQCFDASLFLQMNEKKPTWTCPVCDKPIAVENLSIDGYFQDVINSLTYDASNDIEVLPDGSWKSFSIVKKEKSDDCGPPSKRAKTETQVNFNSTICLDDDLIIEDPPALSQNQSTSSNSNKKVVDVVDLTLDSSSDSEEEDFGPVVQRRKPRAIEEDDDDDNDDNDDDSSSASEQESDASESVASSASSSSASSSISSVHNKTVIPKAVPSRPPPVSRPPSSPQIITLDSPSPEPPQERNHPTLRSNFSTTNNSSNSTTNNNTTTSNHYPNVGTSNATTTSTTTTGRRNPSPNLLSNNDLGSYNFDRWDDGFPNADFATLDFQALEFLDYQTPFDQTPSSNNRGDYTNW